MAWNETKGIYECDRCGKQIDGKETLCPECNTWLREWVEEQSKLCGGKKESNNE